jgi:hypothetical protein
LEQTTDAETAAVEAAPPLMKDTVQPVAGFEDVPPVGSDEASASPVVGLTPPPPMA